jgi:hypothetical protein
VIAGLRDLGDGSLVAAIWELLLAWNERPDPPQEEKDLRPSPRQQVLKRLVDPSVPTLRTLPRDERDLCTGAGNAWTLACDNLSSLPPWLTDALCRLRTGGGLATCQRYTDEDEAIFDVRCPVILTGIEDLAERPDALDRASILTLKPIPDPERLTERHYWARVEAVLPGVLGALLDGVSGALRLLPAVERELTRLPRMADFAVWAEAANRALGFAPNDTLAA